MKNKLKNCILFFTVLLAITQFLSGGFAEFPLVQAISYFPFSENNMLENKRYTLSMYMNYSNIFMINHEGTSFNDMEYLSTVTAFRYGMKKRLTMELFIRLTTIQGGILDCPTIGFHELFGLPSAGRYDYPINQVNYRYKEYFSHVNSTLSTPSILISTAAEILHTRNLYLMGRLGLGIPLIAKAGFNSDKPFLCSGLVLTQQTDIFTIETSGYISLFTPPSWMHDEPMRRCILATEIKGSLGRFSAGYRFRTSPFKTGNLSDTAKQVFIGYRFGKRFEFAVVEDFFPYHTTPDFCFSFIINLLNGSLK